MPTILTLEGYRLFFFSNEGHEPPHVHVEKADGYAKFWLEPVRLAESQDLKRAELRRARQIVEENEAVLIGRWNEFFPQ